MNKKIYVTRQIPEVGLKMLKDRGYEVDVGESLEAPSRRKLLKVLKKKPYDALVCFLTEKIDAEVFDACPSVKIVASFSVGFDHIDCVEAKKRNIFITNTPGTSSTAVAEHAVALMLALSTRLSEGDRFIREGRYKGWDPYIFIGSLISGKTVGLLGLGAIGKEVAQIMSKGFKAKIIYNDINRNEEFEKETGAIFTERENVFRESDFVSIHVPLLESTRHLVNKDTLGMMKKGAFLINTSRGPVVDEVALVEALQKGVIKGCGLDVYEFEPKITKGLMKLPNVVLTPHIASARESVRNAMSECVAENIITYFETGVPKNALK